MDRRYQNKSAADNLSKERLKSSAEALELVPVLAEDITTLESLLAVRNDCIKKFAALSGASALEKQEAEAAFVKSLRRLLGKVHSYGHRTKNVALMDLTDVSKSELLNMREADLVIFGQKFYDVISKISAELISHGVKAEMIDTLKSAIADYDKKKGNVVGDSIDKKQARKGIIDTSKTIDELFAHSIDPLIESIEDDLPEFCDAYFATRTVRDHGLRHRKPVTPPEPPATT